MKGGKMKHYGIRYTVFQILEISQIFFKKSFIFLYQRRQEQVEVKWIMLPLDLTQEIDNKNKEKAPKRHCNKPPVC